jgi:hypothetical protein
LSPTEKSDKETKEEQDEEEEDDDPTAHTIALLLNLTTDLLDEADSKTAALSRTALSDDEFVSTLWRVAAAVFARSSLGPSANPATTQEHQVTILQRTYALLGEINSTTASARRNGRAWKRGVAEKLALTADVVRLCVRWVCTPENKETRKEVSTLDALRLLRPVSKCLRGVLQHGVLASERDELNTLRAAADECGVEDAMVEATDVVGTMVFYSIIEKDTLANLSIAVCACTLVRWRPVLRRRMVVAPRPASADPRG